jgi:prepilin-type N-terminal cleavage/methylation domain-containing protein
VTGHRRVRARGFTLIEIMMVVVLSSIVIAAAVTMVLAFARVQHRGGSVNEAQMANMLAISSLQLDMNNAGYRFPSAAFGARVYNNIVPSAMPWSALANNCGGGSPVAGTDAVEFASGYDMSGPGTTSGGIDPVTSSVVVTFNPTSQTAPFQPAEAAGTGVGTVLLFANKTTACLGKVAAISATPVLRTTVTILNQDYATASAPASLALGCLKTTSRVYRLGQRTRYMICKPTGGKPAAAGLYRQVSGGDGAFGSPVLVQDNVEDLQVSGVYDNTDGGIASTGTGTSCIGAMCACDDALAPSCKLVGADLAPATIDANARVSLLRGLRVQVTSLSNTSATMDSTLAPQLKRPASYDHPAAGAPDNYLRVQQQLTTNFGNFLVMP